MGFMSTLKSLLGCQLSDKEFEHLKNLADQCNVNALFRVGMMYHDTKPPQTIQHLSIKERTRIGGMYLKRAARLGDTMALSVLIKLGHNIDDV